MRVVVVVDDLLAKFPLPEGVDDAVLNRAQLAIALDVSENTITKYISNGMPVLSMGQNGREYEFQCADCYAWVMSRDELLRAKKDRSDAAAAQLSLLFRNEDTDKSHAPAPTLTAKQISEESRAIFDRDRAAEQRGDLVRAPRMRELLEDMLVDFKRTITTVVDYCEMEYGLSPAEIEKLEKRCDQFLIQARIRMDQNLVQQSGQVSNLHSDQASARN